MTPGIVPMPAQSFNPRSRAGSDGPAAYGETPTEGFNPRSRAGSDRVHLTHCISINSFVLSANPSFFRNVIYSIVKEHFVNFPAFRMLCAPRTQ